MQNQKCKLINGELTFCIVNFAFCISPAHVGNNSPNLPKGRTMSTHRRRRLIATLISFVLTGSAAAQERAPAAASGSGKEATYADLRRSEDRTTQRFADRYYKLISLQEWSNEKGTSKVMAKYVAHDPDLKWVKLATVKGSGANRIVKEVTVDVAKLSRTCQSRVRQISVLQLKLDELAAAEKERDSTDATGAARDGEYGERGQEEMAGGRGRYGYDPASEETPADAATNEPGEVAAEAAAAEPPTGADDPDPLGFGELANEPPLAMPAGFGAAPGLGEMPLGDGRYNQAIAPAGGPVDKTKWATDFAAFHANFSSTMDERGVPTIDWGELGELRALNEAAEANAVNASSARYRQNDGGAAERLGEVRWQLEYQAVLDSRAGGQEIQFRVPELPSPLQIQFLADEQDSSPRWADLPPGTAVSVIGRLAILEPFKITVRVRMDENPGPTATPPARAGSGFVPTPGNPR
jgi:hypothetical protein